MLDHNLPKRIAELIPPQQVLDAHDAAHQRQDAGLHALALRLMPSVHLEHIDLDALDDTQPTEDALVIAQERGFADVASLVEAGGLSFPADAKIIGDSSDRWFAECSLAVPLLNPGKSPELHETGTFRFPMVAQRLDYQGDPKIARLLMRAVRGPSDLLSLDKGRWQLRSCEASVSSNWFAYDAQAVRPGQYVLPAKPSSEILAGQSIACLIEDGLRCQVHLSDEQTYLFLNHYAVDCAHHLPQIEEMARSAGVKSAVFDGWLLCETSVRQVKDALTGHRDKPKANVSFVAFDCLYLDGEDLHEEPCSHRWEALKAIVPQDQRFRIAEIAEGMEGKHILLRLVDSAYPLDGNATDWCEVKQDGRNDDEGPGDPSEEQGPVEESADAGLPETAGNEEALSRLWIGEVDSRVEQDDELCNFVYAQRFDGMMTQEACEEVLHRAANGEAVEGIHALSIPLGELQEKYRAAEWRKAPKVLKTALSPVGEENVAPLVHPVTVSGELYIEAPPSRESLLALRQMVVGDGMQFLIAPTAPVNVGQDAFLGTEDNAQWRTAQLPLHEPSWMKFAPQVIEQRQGAGFLAIQSGRAILGVQKPDFHEVFLIFDILSRQSGRYVWNLVTLDGNRVWLGRRPGEQVPYVFRHDQEAEVARANTEEKWIAWNPEGMRILAKTSLRNLLPMNWEDRMEPYDDAAFVDFSEQKIAE